MDFKLKKGLVPQSLSNKDQTHSSSEKLKSNQSLSKDQPWTKAIARTCSQPWRQLTHSSLKASTHFCRSRPSQRSNSNPFRSKCKTVQTQLTKKTSSNPLPDHPPKTLVSPFRAKQNNVLAYPSPSRQKKLIKTNSVFLPLEPRTTETLQRQLRTRNNPTRLTSPSQQRVDRNRTDKPTPTTHQYLERCSSIESNNVRIHPGRDDRLLASTKRDPKIKKRKYNPDPDCSVSHHFPPFFFSFLYWLGGGTRAGVPPGIPGARCAFKNSMTRWFLRFAPRIAFRCVLHPRENRDIHRKELSKEVIHFFKPLLKLVDKNQHRRPFFLKKKFNDRFWVYNFGTFTSLQERSSQFIVRRSDSSIKCRGPRQIGLNETRLPFPNSPIPSVSPFRTTRKAVRSVHPTEQDY